MGKEKGSLMLCVAGVCSSSTSNILWFSVRQCCFRKSKILSITIGCQTPLLSESPALPLPVISLLRSKFPIIKIKPHFLFIFFLFSSANLSAILNLFSCCFSFLSFHNKIFSSKKQLRMFFFPTKFCLSFVWETRVRKDECACVLADGGLGSILQSVQYVLERIHLVYVGIGFRSDCRITGYIPLHLC